MKKVILLGSTVMLFWLMSCTENQRARRFGGTENITLKKNEVLVNMTWKENALWVQTKDTLTGLEYFREKSSYGIWEGEVVINKTIQ